jgi:hypothetical protein
VNRLAYRHITIDIIALGTPAFDDHLATLGREGWQLVSTLSQEKHGYSHAVHMIFMRPLEERS